MKVYSPPIFFSTVFWMPPRLSSLYFIFSSSSSSKSHPNALHRRGAVFYSSGMVFSPNCLFYPTFSCCEHVCSFSDSQTSLTKAASAPPYPGHSIFRYDSFAYARRPRDLQSPRCFLTPSFILPLCVLFRCPA